MEDSYRNPFSDYNANVMDSDKILEYWCSPFRFTQSATISESNIYREQMPIVFMGGRGTGKTMFLRYFSYTVQKKEALREIRNKECDTVISYLKKGGGIGFYLRFDGPVLRSFAGKGLEQERWNDIFTHYFELQVFQSYIEVIRDIINNSPNEISKDSIEKQFVPKISQLLGQINGESKTIEDILKKIEAELEYVTKFRGQIAFSDIEFCPSRGFTSQSLSFEAAKIAKNTIEELRDMNFVIFIDEYENFQVEQQKIVNTLLKFVSLGITFRVGMRLEGFHTFSTISENEFIKEGRDYHKFVFEDFLTKDKDYQKFLMDIAGKRLEAVSTFKEKNNLDISKFLGKKENLEKEAYELVDSRDRHFELLKRISDEFNLNEVRKIINYPNNPLLEMLNMLWVIRGEEPKDVQIVMNGYLKRADSDAVRKYRMDYVDKYKLSLMFLLASIYRAQKKYYSFNTFCFLSSGIVGHFIELCRRSFQYAYFENRELLLNEGIISSDIQDRAARDLANSELEMIPRIEKYGYNLYRFAKNLGSVFRDYHKDPFLRYPETNQFFIDRSSIEDTNLRNAFSKALEWSIIQKKPGLQQTAIGGQKKEIYTLNRIFSPLFEISYRTRGGYSAEDYNSLDLWRLMYEDYVEPKLKSGLSRKLRKKSLSLKRGIQMQIEFIPED